MDGVVFFFQLVILEGVGFNDLSIGEGAMIFFMMRKTRYEGQGAPNSFLNCLNLRIFSQLGSLLLYFRCGSSIRRQGVFLKDGRGNVSIGDFCHEGFRRLRSRCLILLSVTTNSTPFHFFLFLARICE